MLAVNCLVVYITKLLVLVLNREGRWLLRLGWRLLLLTLDGVEDLQALFDSAILQIPEVLAQSSRAVNKHEVHCSFLLDLPLNLHIHDGHDLVNPSWLLLRPLARVLHLVRRSRTDKRKPADRRVLGVFI